MHYLKCEMSVDGRTCLTNIVTIALDHDDGNNKMSDQNAIRCIILLIYGVVDISKHGNYGPEEAGLGESSLVGLVSASHQLSTSALNTMLCMLR